MKIKNPITKKWLRGLRKSFTVTTNILVSQSKSFLQDKVHNHRVAKGELGYSLSPLYPTVEKEHHAQYVSSLNKAAKDKKIRNLALTGHYGSGKSSILEWFMKNKKRKVVRISFSTLGANIEKYITTNEGDSKDKRLGVLSNLIQKEIVKHILFNDKPSSLPNSRYSRAAKPNKLSLLLLSLLIAAIIGITCYTLGFSSFIESLSLHQGWITIYLWATGFVCTWLIVAIILFIGGSKIKLSKISGGPFSLSLSGEKSYFDEYLDEIIYYFEATGRRIVIIEDIDRFNTLYIFENLRQLNTILNNSKQIRGRVLFVYAIKDSVFVQNTFDDSIVTKKNPSSENTAETIVDDIEEDLAKEQDGDSSSRITNRTKFFDLIIPVVPFITISTSKTFIKSMLDKIEHGVTDELIETVSKHVIDMRLIKNIYNEFVVFKDKVIVGSRINSLDDDTLFALIAYKNMYLSDFENIKDGTSVLDGVYGAHRDFVAKRGREITGELSRLSTRLTNNAGLEMAAKNYGEKLLKYTDGVASQIGKTIANYTFEGKAYSIDEIKTLAFWEVVSKADLTSSFVTTFTASGYYGDSHQQTFSKSFIVNELLGDINFAVLKSNEEQNIKNKIQELRVERKNLTHMRLDDAMDTYEDDFLPIVENIINDGRLLEPKLLEDLLKFGHVDSHYILYTSVYHKNGMSPDAANFAIQFIQREDQQSMHYPLDKADIERLLKENISYVDERSMYNLSIVDYLVTNSIDKRTKAILSNIGEGKYNSEEFINEYVSNSKNVFEFIARITPDWENVFDFIINSDLVKPNQRNGLISAALVNTSERKEYVVDENITNYIVENAADIIALNTATEQNKVNSIEYILKKLNARFKSVDGLSLKVKRAVIDNDLYIVNENNLKSILGGDDYSLDVIKEVNENVYRNALAHLGEYTAMLDSLEGNHFALIGNQGFEDVINDIATQSADGLGEVLDRADTSNCIVNELNSLKSSAWVQALGHTIISNTFGNVIDYYEYSHEENEVVGPTLGSYLNNVGTLVLDGSMDIRDASVKDMIIIAILNSPHVLTDVKVNIVKDCYNGTTIDVDEISSQEGSLYGDLLKNGSIEDNAESLNALSQLSWTTRKHYIVNANELLTYAEEVEWKSEDIEGISVSEEMDELKKYIIENVNNYEGIMGYRAASNFVEYAYAQGMHLTSAALTTLFTKAGGLRDEAAIGLVNNMQDSSKTVSGISAPLAKLGGSYKLLTEHLKRPKLDNEDYNKILVSTLDSLGMVSKIQETNNGTQIQINLKASW